MRKLNLKELELKLPKIDENYSKILIGGNTYADDCAIGCGEDLNNPKPIPELQGPMEDDNSLDLDVSVDGYQEEEDGSIEGVGSSNSSTNSYVGGSFINNLPSTLTNGVNISDYVISGGMNFGDMNSHFIEQFYTILQTNSVIAYYLNEISNMGIQINFSIDTIPNDSFGNIVNAHTLSNMTSDITNIVFNLDQMNPDNGWESESNGQNPTESLTETVLHEIMHAYYNAIFDSTSENLIASGIVPNPQNMHGALTGSHGVDFANMFVTLNNTSGLYEFIPNNDLNDTQHNYMHTHAEPLFEQSKEELNNDIAALQAHINNLEQLINEAENNLNTGSDPNGGENGPTNQQLQSNYNNLVLELADLLQNWGWLLHIND